MKHLREGRQIWYSGKAVIKLQITRDILCVCVCVCVSVSCYQHGEALFYTVASKDVLRNSF